MAEPQQEIYTIMCLILEEDTPFPVEIAKNKIVGILRDMIKEKRPDLFASIPAVKLALYHLEIMDDKDLVKNVKEKMLENQPTALRSTTKLANLFGDGPKEEIVHIIVKPPTYIPSAGEKHGQLSDDNDGDPVSKRLRAGSLAQTGSKRKFPEPGNSSSDSEAPDNKKQKVQHKPRLSDPSDGLYSRSKTVEALYKKLTEHKFIFVRGTPASGKSSLAMLLRKYISEKHPEKEVHFLPRCRDEPDQKPIMSWDKWLEDEGWTSPPNGVLILDEAQLSYWDDSFWLTFIKPINASTPYMVILFASYGSASRNLLDKSTPLIVEEGQLVGLVRGPTEASVGLLLARDEMEGVVEKRFPNHLFDVSLLDYVYSLTSGHVGACCDALCVVKNDLSYRTNHRGYTYDDFTLNFEMSTFLKELGGRALLSRGLPMRDDLEDPKKLFVSELRRVLSAPSRSVFIGKEDDQRNSKHPLRLCLEQGWLFSEPASGGKVKYRFASQLHELYTGWLLLRREDLITSPDLQTFVIEVIKHFSPQNLQTREDLSTTTPQPIPEAQFQQEFYRACCFHTGGCVTTFPECGNPKGRIDFFIRSKKWGVELLRDGVRLRDHNSRFTTGEYGTWVHEGKMKDYILIDFRSKKPSQESDIKPLIYVVSTDKWQSVEIYNNKLKNIGSFCLLYHSQ